MINAIQFYDAKTDCDFYKQLLNTNVSQFGYFVPHIIDNVLFPFQCAVGTTLSDSFTVTVYIVNVSSAIEIDITSALAITRLKNTSDSNTLYVLSKTETDISTSEPQAGLNQLKIIASDGIADDVILWSDVFCNGEGSEVLPDMNLIDGGYNDTLSQYAFVIDGGFDTV